MVDIHEQGARISLAGLVQYDLCQLSGAVSDRKYEKAGGPGLAACAELVRRYSAHPAVDPCHLVRWVFFNLYVGNDDSHAKNLSIYSAPGQGVTLTSFYDLMCRRPYPGQSPEFALAIGGEVRPGEMGAEHLALMARQLGMQRRFLVQQARDMADRLAEAIDRAAREIAPALTPSARTRRARCAHPSAAGGCHRHSRRSQSMPDLLTIRRIRWGRVLLALWAAAIGRPVIAVDGARPEPWRVLILMGFDSALPALRQHDEAFRGALQSAAPDGVTIFTETLDTARFDYAALAPEYLALTRKKYAAQPIDLVVGVSDGAVAFLQDHHACLWPGAPVLYTALASLRADGSTGMAERISAARDGDAEVRAAAADSLDAAPAAQRLYALGPLLRDPVRGVRSAAARGLSSLPAAQIDAALRPAFDAALAEYIAAQSVSLDMPGARLNLAVVHQNTGRPDLAEAHYLAALKIDPDFTPARADLSQLYNQTGRNAEAERVLTDGLKRQPTIGELQYSLGLLLAEEQRLPEAAQALGRAAQLLPERARVHYNLGLALQQLGRRQPAEQALLRAQQLAPQDATTVYALAVFYAQGGQRTLTLQWAERLQALSPDDPGVRQFIERLRHAG